MFVYNGGEFVGYFLNSLLPGYFFKYVADLFERMRETISMVLKKLDVQSLTAGITLGEWVILIAANLDYLIVLGPNLEPASIPS